MKGFTLVEVMVAIVVLALAITGTAGAMSHIMRLHIRTTGLIDTTNNANTYFDTINRSIYRPEVGDVLIKGEMIRFNRSARIYKVVYAQPMSGGGENSFVAMKRGL